MKPPVCRICQEAHWGPDHVWAASNKAATNTKPATNRNATNRPERPKDVDGGSGPRMSASAGEGAKGSGPKTSNRRSREAYNAYQREYMRKKRALKSA